MRASRSGGGDDDVFSSVGGLELGPDASDPRLSPHQAHAAAAAPSMGQTGSYGDGQTTGDLPAGVTPSRTLFVRNLAANVGDAELKQMFEVGVGPITTIHHLALRFA